MDYRRAWASGQGSSKVPHLFKEIGSSYVLFGFCRFHECELSNSKTHNMKCLAFRFPGGMGGRWNLITHPGGTGVDAASQFHVKEWGRGGRNQHQQKPGSF